MKLIQTAVGALLARRVYMVDPECCCLNSNILLQTYLYIYIYLLCMGDIILTISLAAILIILVSFVKHTFFDPIQPHESFPMSVKCLSLKCLAKIIIFHISGWLVDNSTGVSSFESTSYIKVSYIDVFGSLVSGFPSIPFLLNYTCIIVFNSHI